MSNAAEDVLEQLKKEVLDCTDLDKMFRLGLRLQENKTMWFRYAENSGNQISQTALNSNIATIGTLLEIWKDRKDLMVQKARIEGEPSTIFNKKFRHEAQNFLNPEVYKTIAQRVNAGK
jgi:hypothetical protein